MRLTSRHIAEFQKLYLEEFETEIPEKEASERAIKLIELLETVYKPITKEDYQKYKIN